MGAISDEYSEYSYNSNSDFAIKTAPVHCLDVRKFFLYQMLQFFLMLSFNDV